MCEHPRVPDFRYPQFCPLARAAEVVGERWTLLIVRELLLGPKRFSDLRGPLCGVSSSVLADRLGRLEARGVVSRRTLPAPAPATIYELSEAGRALAPAVLELARWGMRFLGPREAGDRVEPAWLVLGLQTLVAPGPTPSHRFNLTALGEDSHAELHVAGGPDGTRVTAGHSAADVSLEAPTLTLMALAVGQLDPDEALRGGALRAEGDLGRLPAFPALFRLTSSTQQGA
jgi:DNA-binding HxlR family transcriptional regulator